MHLLSPAKINLFLEVLGEREDGFHEIETWMTTVSLFDEITVETADETAVHCEHPDVPDGSENLAYDAVQLLREQTGTERHARVTIEKNIPPGSGLGGGSSNAAMTLIALNRLWSLSLDTTDLMRIGARIGSDVNFFLNGAAAVCRGRGETVNDTPLPYPLHILLLIPNIRCKTPRVYENTAKFLNSSPKRVSLASSEIERNWDDRKLFNRLQEPAFDTYPTLKKQFERIRRRSSLTPILSGSGSAIYCASPERDQVQEEMQQLNELAREEDLRITIVETLPHDWQPIQTS